MCWALQEVEKDFLIMILNTLTTQNTKKVLYNFYFVLKTELLRISGQQQDYGKA